MSRHASPADRSSGAPCSDASQRPTPGVDQDSTEVSRKIADALHAAGQPSDFAELSRRIRSRATDMIVIAIVVAAGLSTAGWVSRWWQNDDALTTASPDVLPPAPWESPDGVALRFGDQPWTMHRRHLLGDEESATTAVVSACRTILEEPDLIESLSEADAAELKLLAALESFAPTDHQPGSWAVYELGGFLPWVVGVREMEPDNAEGKRRLLCWSMALPQPDGSWVLHTVNRHGGSGGTANPTLELPLPSGTQPSLRLSAARGGSLTCFSGEGSVDGWARELDDAWNRLGWHTLRDWTISGNGRSAVFSRTTGEGDVVTAEVVLSATSRGAGVGTIIITTQSVP